MSFRAIYWDISETPSKVLFLKFIDRIFKYFSSKASFREDLSTCSYSQKSFEIDVNLELNKFPSKELDSKMAENWTIHCFDILGSGWTDWNKKELDANQDYQDVKESNRTYSSKLQGLIKSINPNYRRIDWLIDPVGKYRFSHNCWYRKIGPIPKQVDVKVIWELTRLQHLLPMLIANAGDEKKNLQIEVICQLLDFIAFNPPRWGLAWYSTMDVAIRSANITICILFLKEQGALDSKLEEIFTSSLLDHQKHILENLESKQGLGNNHYLSNLCGFLVTSTAIPGWEENVKVVAKSLIEEIRKQFLTDGGNFEGSSTYHALALEMAIYGLSAIQYHRERGVPCDEKGLEEAEEKLFRAGGLLKSLRQPDGSIPQFGDNDSGRFFKSSTLIYSNPLDYINVEKLWESYFDRSDSDTFESILIGFLGKSRSHFEIPRFDLAEAFNSAEKRKFKFKEVQSFISENSLHDGLKLEIYPESGYILFRGKNIYLCINALKRHTIQYWPHGHNDSLTYNLYLNGKPVVRDPGSYTYTRDPILRNKYRSEEAHHVPLHRERQNVWLEGHLGVFRTKSNSKVSIIRAENFMVELELRIGKIVHRRRFEIMQNDLLITDQSNSKFDLCKGNVPFSPSYGVKVSN